MSQHLSPIKLQIYDFVAAYCNKRGKGPTADEIAEALQLFPIAAEFHLVRMAGLGMVTFVPGKSLRIEPVGVS